MNPCVSHSVTWVAQHHAPVLAASSALTDRPLVGARYVTGQTQPNCRCCTCCCTCCCICSCDHSRVNRLSEYFLSGTCACAETDVTLVKACSRRPSPVLETYSALTPTSSKTTSGACQQVAPRQHAVDKLPSHNQLCSNTCYANGQRAQLTEI